MHVFRNNMNDKF